MREIHLVDVTGIPFKVHPTPVKGKDGKQLFYVRPSGKLRASARMLDEYCSQQFHLHRGEMQRALDVFMRAAGEFIAKGYRVETPFGTFSPRLGLKREVSNPDEVTENDVTFEGIDFRFNKDFVEDVQRWIKGFQREDNPNTREVLQDTQSLEQALQNSLRVHKGYTTVKSFAYHAHLTYYSAKKQLDAWTQGDAPRLLKTKMGQQYIYTET